MHWYSSHNLSPVDLIYGRTLKKRLHSVPYSFSEFVVLCLFILTAAYLRNLLKIPPYHHTSGLF